MRSLRGQQENQKFNMEQSSRDEGPGMPSDKHCDASATQSSAGYELVVESRTSSPACGLRPAERINNNNISDASKLAAARISSIAIQSRRSHSRSSRGQTGGGIQLGGAQPPVSSSEAPWEEQALQHRHRHREHVETRSKILANSIIAVSRSSQAQNSLSRGAQPHR